MFKNIFKNKKVLITGHTGFKGSWLTTWLLDLEANVIGVSKDIPTNPSMFVSLNLEDRISHNIFNITNIEKLKSLGWFPRFSLEDGLKNTIDLEKKLKIE